MKLEKITIRVIVDADKQKVWDYYTKPEHITQWNFADPSWHCPTASNDLVIGGRYFARMEARDGSVGFDFDAVYTEIELGERISYQFDDRLVTVMLNPSDDNTKVTISFDPENENPIELQRDGWLAILNNFKRYTEAN